ncbi:MAG: zinc-binding alcohol dehydrogenase family protein [Chitinophagales bacterium]
MKSLVCVRPGQLEYREEPMPRLEPGHAIIRIRRVGVCGTDLHAFQGTQPYFKYPRILGHELAADFVEADQAPGFEPGDRVSIIPYYSCGNCIACRSGRTNCCVSLSVCGVHENGGMREYFSVPSGALIAAGGLNYQELALIEPLSIGAHAVSKAGIKKGEFVLIVGTGPIGLGVIQFAILAGARVIAMDTNPFRLDVCQKNLPVHQTILAGKDDITGTLREITRGDMPTTIFDCTGNLQAINKSFQWIAHSGKYVLVGLQKEEIQFSHPEFHKREATLMSSRNATRSDFERVISAMQDREIQADFWITHQVQFGKAREEFPCWIDPHAGVIKAVINW